MCLPLFGLAQVDTTWVYDRQAEDALLGLGPVVRFDQEVLTIKHQTCDAHIIVTQPGRVLLDDRVGPYPGECDPQGMLAFYAIPQVAPCVPFKIEVREPERTFRIWGRVDLHCRVHLVEDSERPTVDTLAAYRYVSP